ncbi:hypothetical protein F2Q69_00030132 [Brassica cretica]|uniref:Protein kinase domain-containing protein n=1 Tax=Brassica cretica TaxID=69181 RepID=A0A8S9RVE3_BRACR|nr:hypothetical protein F2Q69_00030132 [Brassica cretica]
MIEADELAYELLGTPNEEMWPGVSTLKNWHEYPQWKPLSLSTSVPKLDQAGLDLLSKMLQYEPAKRISAKILIFSLGLHSLLSERKQSLLSYD